MKVKQTVKRVDIKTNAEEQTIKVNRSGFYYSHMTDSKFPTISDFSIELAVGDTDTFRTMVAEIGKSKFISVTIEVEEPDEV